MCRLERNSVQHRAGIRWFGALALTLGLLVGVSGCGYQQSGNPNSQTAGDYKWKSLYREDVQTVAVPIFTNKDFRRGTERDLTMAIIKQMEAKTPYKVVPRERADTILEGEIVSVQINTISESSATALPQEQLLSLTVNFIWKDLHTGRILVQRRNFQQTTPYYPTLGEGQFVGAQEAVEQLGLAIVQELQANW